jgi:hypothetical protein
MIKTSKDWLQWFVGRNGRNFKVYDKTCRRLDAMSLALEPAGEFKCHR